MRRIECIVSQIFDGRTVGDVARRELHMSRHALTRAKFQEDGILLDGARVRSNERVRAGQRLSIAVGDTRDAAETGRVEPIEGPLCVAYEDGDLIVVDKPAGIVMYPYEGIGEPTLGNYLMHYLQEGAAKGGEAAGRLHPVHRLDRGTSGLVVFAKNAHAQHILQKALHSQAFGREYLALCHGVPFAAEGTVDAPIARKTYAPASFCVCDDGKPARTHYKVLRSWEVPAGVLGGQRGGVPDEVPEMPDGVLGGALPEAAGVLGGAPGEAAGVLGEASDGMPGGVRVPAASAPGTSHSVSLVRLQLETGRTHQIRVHLSTMGCPLVGDELYGGACDGMQRPALHSACVRLVHPVTGEWVRIHAQLPNDMKNILHSLAR